MTRHLVLRPLAVRCIAAAVALTLGACTPPLPVTPTTSAPGPVTLNALFTDQARYSQTQIDAMLAGYEADHPDVKVTATYVPRESLYDKIVTSAPAGTYDVVLMDVVWPAEFTEKNIVLDVTSRYPASWQQDMLGGAYTAAQYNGKFYGVAWGPSTKFLYYNKDLVAAVGASEADLDTWDGVLMVAQRLKDSGRVKYPLAWSWGQSEDVVCDYGQLLGAFGGQFTDASGALAVNQPAGVQTLTWMTQTIDSGLTNPGSIAFLAPDVEKALAQGQAAFGLGWESAFAALQDPAQSQVAGKIGVLPTPAGPTGARPGINGGMALAIPAKSKHPDAAWDLITYLTSQPVQNANATGWLPNWTSSYADPAVTGQAPELFAAAPTAYAELIARPAVPNYSAISQVLQANIQSALLGGKEPQQAMDDAVAETKG